MEKKKNSQLDVISDTSVNKTGPFVYSTPVVNVDPIASFWSLRRLKTEEHTVAYFFLFIFLFITITPACNEYELVI